MDGSASRDSHIHPSFSSSLLDHIYRSIDQQSTPKQTNFPTPNACFDNNLAQQKPKPITTSQMRFQLNNSTHHSRSCCCPQTYQHHHHLVKPIRTGHEHEHDDKIIKQTKSTKHEAAAGKFVKTKSKALKIYTDLKQPISPGGRLATFLNSLFSSGNKLSNTNTRTSKSATKSSSSFSGSSKPKSKTSSLTFYPLTHQDYYCHPCRHKQEEETNLKTTKQKINKLNLSDENPHISEAATTSNLLNNLVEREFKSSGKFKQDHFDDDCASDSSSDLFELSAVGLMHRYQQELPVYETTQLHSNPMLM